MAKRPTKKTKEAPSDSGMFTSPGRAAPPSGRAGSTAPSGMMYAGGTPNFDERTGQPAGTTKGDTTKQTPRVTPDSARTTESASPSESTQASAPAPAPETTQEAPPQYYITDPNYGGTTGRNHGFDNGGYGGSHGNFLIDVQPTDEAGLRSYYNSQPLLENQFGSFENFKSYSAEYASLLNESLGTANPWWDVPEEAAERFQAEANLDADALRDAGLSDEQISAIAANQGVGSLYSYLGDDLSNIPITLPDGTTTTVDITSDYELFTPEAEAGSSIGLYNSFANSEAVKALNEKYGINPEALSAGRFVGEDGDIWNAQWNGSGFVTRKVQKVDDSFGIGDAVKLVATIMLTAGAGAALGAAGLAASGTASAATSASIGALKGALSTAIVNGVTTGEIDPEQILQSAVTGGITGAVSDFLTGLVPDDVVQSLSTGNEAVDNILSSMVKDVVRQGVIEGDIDLNQVITSGLITTAEEFIDWFDQKQENAEAQERWNEARAREIENLTVETMESTLGESLGAALAEQEASSMSDSLKALQGSISSIIEDAYSVDPIDPVTSGPSIEDVMASSVDDADSELADTTSDLIADTTESGLSYRSAFDESDVGTSRYYVDSNGNRLLQSDITGLRYTSEGDYVDTNGNRYELAELQELMPTGLLTILTKKEKLYLLQSS
jgi:hypothetical protein